MNDKKISELELAQPISPNDILAIVQNVNGMLQTYQVTVDQLSSSLSEKKILEITENNVANYIIDEWLIVPPTYDIIFVNVGNYVNGLYVSYGSLKGIKSAGTPFANGKRITIMGNCNFRQENEVDYAMAQYLYAYSNNYTGRMTYAFQDFIFWNNRWYSKWY